MIFFANKPGRRTARSEAVVTVWFSPKVLHLTELAAASARFWSWSLLAHEAEGTRRQIHGRPRGVAVDQQRQQKDAVIDGAKQLAGRSPAVRQPHGIRKFKEQADLNMTRSKNPGG